MLLAPWRWVPVRVAVEGWQSGLRAWWGGVRWCRRPCLCSSSSSHFPPHKTRPDLTTVCPLPPPAPLLCTPPFSVHVHSFSPAGLSRSSRSWAGSPCSPVAAQQTHPVGIGGKSGGGGCAELSLSTMGLWISGASRDFSSRPKLGRLLEGETFSPAHTPNGCSPHSQIGAPCCSRLVLGLPQAYIPTTSFNGCRPKQCLGQLCSAAGSWPQAAGF